MTERIACAIYTRKSSEEGLEQSFNSLDAQREACESYIQSQKHEGWYALKTHFDDGGCSGGNMDRPALQRLLHGITSGEINVVVVYKIDRLTRSLLDFAKIVQTFDANSVTFVSVTQQFNTTTSMGRLTLNILLSFAQFERELTGERIRDKIAASKKKGMWMGGFVPLGYQVEDRKLVIEPSTAHTVEEIFRQYVSLGCVSKLKAYLDAKGIKGKRSRPFSRGALYHILNNRVYLGETVHRKSSYPGEHAAVISKELWQRVASTLRDNDPVPRKRPRLTDSSLLSGVIFDAAGVRYTPTHSLKDGKRYRYYTSRSAIQGQEPVGPPRIPAVDLENIVAARVQALLSSPQNLIAALKFEKIENLRSLAQVRARQWTKVNPVERANIVKSILKRVVVLSDCVELEISSAALASALTGRPSSPTSTKHRPIRVACPVRLRTLGNQVRIITDFEPENARPSFPLIKAIVRARNWYEQIARGEIKSFEDLATQNHVTSRYVRRIFRCATLSPEIVDGLLTDASLNLAIEKLRSPLSLDWAGQRLVAQI